MTSSKPNLRSNFFEFQKRGLPHAHIILIVDPAYRPRTAADVDAVVYAETPDRNEDPLLWETVTTSMLHGHCDNQKPCFRPGAVRNSTPIYESPSATASDTFEDDGHPINRRRDMPERAFVKQINRAPPTFDNAHVLPYKPYLTRKYNCHINVEITSGVRAVEYTYKYIYKGEDRALAEVRALPVGQPAQPVDDIEHYINARYITVYHACSLIFSYHMHQHDPSLYRLALHLPDQQIIVYDEEANLENIANNHQRGRTMLTEFFVYCTAHPEYTCKLLYTNAPDLLTWHEEANPKHWQARAGGSGRTIGRLYGVSPGAGEIYYLRMLLNIVPSPRGAIRHLSTMLPSARASGRRCRVGRMPCRGFLVSACASN